MRRREPLRKVRYWPSNSPVTKQASGRGTKVTGLTYQLITGGIPPNVLQRKTASVAPLRWGRFMARGTGLF